MMRKRFLGISTAAVLLLVGMALYFLYPQKEQQLGKMTTSASRSNQLELKSSLKQDSSRIEASIKNSPLPEDLVSKHDTALEELVTFLPKWLLEQGNLFQDSREINGHTVLRTRGRYTWEDGEMMEIEITHIGEGADDELIKSLGFNVDHLNTETERGFTQTHDEDWYLMNQEYDHNDQAGSIQYLIENRYLIEIQLQQLPEKAFQEILDESVPFDAILSRVNE